MKRCAIIVGLVALASHAWAGRPAPASAPASQRSVAVARCSPRLFVEFDRALAVSKASAGGYKDICDPLERVLRQANACPDGRAFLTAALPRVSTVVRGETESVARMCVSAFTLKFDERAEKAAREARLEDARRQMAAMKEAEVEALRQKRLREAESRRIAQDAYDKCTRDRKCRAARTAEEAAEIADEICSLVVDRRDLLRQIAKEKAYSRRAGVVNLRALQDLKEQLMTWDERLAEHKARYREIAGKPFSGKCR